MLMRRDKRLSHGRRGAASIRRQRRPNALSLSVANDYASLPIAFCLYLPEEWANDHARCAKAGVPEEVEFQTKPQIALDQVRAGVEAGVPLGVVLADAGYGNGSDFRDELTNLGLRYAVGVLSTTRVWPEGGGPLEPKPWSGRGRPPKRLRRDDQHRPVTVKDLAIEHNGRFRHVTWREGTKGKLRGRFLALRVRSAHRDYTRGEARDPEWLLVEWPEGEAEPTKYFLSTLPKATSVKRLVETVKIRWRIEHDYEELKQELGLTHYEGRRREVRVHVGRQRRMRRGVGQRMAGDGEPESTRRQDQDSPR